MLIWVFTQTEVQSRDSCYTQLNHGSIVVSVHLSSYGGLGCDQGNVIYLHSKHYQHEFTWTWLQQTIRGQLSH